MKTIFVNNKKYTLYSEIIETSNVFGKTDLDICLADDLQNSENLQNLFDDLNLWCRFKFNIKFLKCFNNDELQNLFNLVCELENFKLFKLIYSYKKVVVLDKYKLKYIDYLNDDDIFTIPIEKLQSLKYNPTKYKCLNSLFGVESDISKNEILNLKHWFEENVKNIFDIYPDYAYYVQEELTYPKDYYNIDIKNNIDFKISSKFKFEDFHRVDAPFSINAYGYLEAQLKYNYRWFDFINWCFYTNNKPSGF